MSYNRYKQKAILAMVAGFAAGIVSAIIFAFTLPELIVQLALITGLITVIVTFPMLVLKELIDDLKYKKFEEELGKSVIHTMRAHIETKAGVISSKVYFTEDTIILAYAKGKKFLRENINLSEIFTVVTDGFFTLNIYTKDKQIFKLNSAELPEVLPFMKKHSSNMDNK